MGSGSGSGSKRDVREGSESKRDVREGSESKRDVREGSEGKRDARVRIMVSTRPLRRIYTKTRCENTLRLNTTLSLHGPGLEFLCVLFD